MSLFGGSSSSSSSFVDRRQQPFLDFLRNTGQGFASASGSAQAFGQVAGQDLYGQGQQFLGSLASNPFLSGLQQQAGGNPELVDRQIGQLQADLGRAFNQEVLPGIRNRANAVGALGGGREGVARGLAAQGFADAFSRGATDIYSADAGRSLQAGISGAGINAQSALGGLSSLQGLMGLGLSQFTGGFAPLGLFNNIVGAPTVLNKTTQRTKGAVLSPLGFSGSYTPG